MYPNAIYACSLNVTFYTSSKRVGMERVAREGLILASQVEVIRYYSDKTKDMTRLFFIGR